MKTIECYTKQALAEIKNTVKEPNKSIILDFYKSLVSENLNSKRILEYIKATKRFHFMRNGKNFKRYDRKDVDDIIYQLKSVKRYYLYRQGKRGESSNKTVVNKPYSDHYIHFYQVSLMKFFKWLYEGKHPDFLSNMRYVRTKKINITADDILSLDEIRRMAEATDHPRDKAFVWSFFELGCRMGEMKHIRRKDIEFDDFGARITINSEKQGSQEMPQRTLRIINGAPYLASWLNLLPDKNPEAYIWVGCGTRGKGELMTYTAYQRILQRSADKAGVKKKVWNHLIRHSRETYFERMGVPRAIQKKHMGWKKTSNMPDHYSHFNSKDVDDYILEMNGVKQQENGKTEIKAIICPRCKKLNSPTDLCIDCGFPLNDKSMIRKFEEKRMAEAIGRGILALADKDERLKELIIKNLEKEGY